MILEYNLQLFADADDKTEPATEKKLSDARKEGQVAKAAKLQMQWGYWRYFWC